MFDTFDTNDEISQPSSESLGNEDTNSSNNDTVLAFHSKILLLIVYLTISLLAILGNAATIYLVLAFQRMRTVTNLFIVNLAVGDILMAILCIPFSFVSNLLLQRWPFGSVLCSLVSYSQAVSVFISAYTLVAISIDRYIAIIFPLRIRMSKPQAKIIIILIWSVALLTPLPTALLSSLVKIPITNQPINNLTNDLDNKNVNNLNENDAILNVNNLNNYDSYLDNNLKDDLFKQQQQFINQEENQKLICQEQWPNNTQRYYYSITLMILQYFLPLSVLIYTYTKIAYVVFGRPIAANQDQVRAHQSKQKMIKMMIIVCVIYSLCWLPLNLLIVAADLNENVWQFSYIIYIWLISHLLAMSHCSVNPFIYIWMNNKFRAGFKHIYFSFISCCGLNQKLNINHKGDCKEFQHSVHNYSIQTQLTQRRPLKDNHHKNNLKQQNSNNNSNNSNEPVDIELALVSENGAVLESDNNNNLHSNLHNNLHNNNLNNLINGHLAALHRYDDDLVSAD